MVVCLGCMEEYNEKYDVCPYCGYAKGTPAKETYYMEPGSILQRRYIVGRVLGSGGFGVTYIGRDEQLQKKVAIKEYLPGEFSTRIPGQTELTVFSDEKKEQFEQGVHKFVDEAKRLAKFQTQDNIVKIFDTFSENNTAYIVMEYLEGETLKEKLKREEKMDVDTAIDMIMPLTAALSEVHREGIIHRDISPDNIYITRDGVVKLLDFGAARNATSTGHSKSLSVIVKPGYAPTEQYQSKGEQSTWTDVYALAATFYRMITGVVPDESMERVGKDLLKPPSKLGVKIEKGVENALMNALQVNYKDRTRTMDIFARELRAEDTKRNRVKGEKVDIGKWTAPMKIGVGAGVACIVTLGILLATGVIGKLGVLSGNQDLAYQTIPDLTGVNYSVAETMLGEMGISMRQAAYSYSDTMSENLIVTQSIAGGTQAEEGQTMEVIVSLGKERRILGDVTGYDLEAIRSKFDGFYYTIDEEECEIAEGCIVTVKDESGQAVNLEEELGVGNSLVVVLSKGNSYGESNSTEVPDLGSLSFEDARESVKNASLHIKKTGEESSDTVPKGAIISQDIEAGSGVDVGSVISVVVSSGATPMISIPNVLENTEEDARKTLEELGFTVKIVNEPSSLIEKGMVIRTNPQVNEQAEEGSEIEVVISAGPDNNANTTNRKTTEKSNDKKTTEKKTQDNQDKKKDKNDSKTTQKSTEKKTTEKAKNPDDDKAIGGDGEDDKAVSFD